MVQIYGDTGVFESIICDLILNHVRFTLKSAVPLYCGHRLASSLVLLTGGANSNLFVWDCLIEGPKDTPYENGVFPARLNFPQDYPLSPPKLVFTPSILHPNIYANGEVCISILHAPGEDPHQYERAEERWSPVQNVEKILLSVMSMLSEPNVESGANIDACKLWRDNRSEFERQVRNDVRKSLGL